jgi:hypothetical protein
VVGRLRGVERFLKNHLRECEREIIEVPVVDVSVASFEEPELLKSGGRCTAADQIYTESHGPVVGRKIVCEFVNPECRFMEHKKAATVW